MNHSGTTLNHLESRQITKAIEKATEKMAKSVKALLSEFGYGHKLLLFKLF